MKSLSSFLLSCCYPQLQRKFEQCKSQTPPSACWYRYLHHYFVKQYRDGCVLMLASPVYALHQWRWHSQLFIKVHCWTVETHLHFVFMLLCNSFTVGSDWFTAFKRKHLCHATTQWESRWRAIYPFMETVYIDVMVSKLTSFRTAYLCQFSTGTYLAQFPLGGTNWYQVLFFFLMYLLSQGSKWSELSHWLARQWHH